MSSKANAIQVNPTARAFLRLLWPAEGVTEVCVFNGKRPSHVGYFDDIGKAAQSVEVHDGKGNVYVTLNPVKRDLLARRNNRLAAGSYNDPVERTKDTEILCDSWLLLDVDPKRTSGISATEEELDAALDVAQAVYEWLFEVGITKESTLIGKSGNGAYVMVRLPDYPVTKENTETKRAIVNFIADKFSTDKVEIDRSVFNPSRLVCAIGTMKMKGENMPDRPHRRSELVAIADERFDPIQEPPSGVEPFDLYTLMAPMLHKAEEKKAEPEKSHNGFDSRRVAHLLTNPRPTDRGITYYDCPNCGGPGKLWLKDATGRFGCFHKPPAGACESKELRKKLKAMMEENDIEPEEDDEIEGCGADRESRTQTLVRLALENSELFHDAGEDCYATVTVGEHRETFRIGSRACKDWLAVTLYRETEQAARTENINEAVTILRAKALYDGEKRETHVRIAEHAGAVYLDLCDDEWRQVKIDENGWGMIESDKSPVKFVRAKGMQPLPTPVRGGSISELRDLLNLPKDDKDNWPLIAGWLVAAFKPSNDGFDYPVLAIHGEQGSGKSTAQRILRDLIDPNKATLRNAPRDERDLAITAAHGRIVSCDNLTNISEALSNAFCRLSTGGGFATRELFTDDGEVIFDAQRPVIINGIAEVIAKSDLLDRSMLVYLPAIPKDRRWKKRVLNQKFTGAQPRILGALLDAVSAGLKRMREGIEMTEWPRMSDFAEWAIACEKALGLAEGDFIKAYLRNIERADDLAIEASRLAQEIIATVDDVPDHTWIGTTGGLLKALNLRLEAGNENPKKVLGWPQAAKGLGAKLKELAPNLRRLGIEIEFGPRGKNGYTMKIFRKADTPVPPPPEQVHQVHQAHSTNEINNLDGELGGELGQNPLEAKFTPPANGAGATVDGELHDGELPDQVHHEVHPVSYWEQRASERDELGELLSEPSEDGPPYEPCFDSGAEDWKLAMGIEN